MRESPIDVAAKYTRGVTWPARKAEVIAVMERNGAPQDVLETVQSLERERFSGAFDVHQALWNKA